jgi:hypothetical protein
MVEFEIADPFRRPCFVGHCFAPRFIEDKFNTFILKNKLIAKSVEGIFVQPQKSSLEQLKIMVLTK